MKKIILLLFSTIAMQSQTVNYTESFENFANPERGFYHEIATRRSIDPIGTYTPLNQTVLTNFRVNQGITLIRRIFYLDEFVNIYNIPSGVNDYFSKMNNDFTALRNAGMKCIIKFQYTNSESNPIDAPKANILHHIDQLKIITQLNEDVISSVEAGFIGTYGEWTISNTYGNGSSDQTLTPNNRLDRKEIGLKILELAPNRMVAFRTPYFQRLIIGTNPLASANPYNGSIGSRVAAHNDCFLASIDDMGTYTSNPITDDQDWLANQSNYTFSSGETCRLFDNNNVLIPFLLPNNARTQMERFHFNNLNIDWSLQVVSPTNGYWSGIPATNGSFLDEVRRKLGYRFVMLNSNITNNILTINIKNIGFANCINKRKVFLIFRSTSVGNPEYKIELTETDVRLWKSGFTNTISKNLTKLNNIVPPGTYRLFLNLPDLINPNPLYSIQFANTNTWSSNNSGYIILNHMYTVSNTQRLTNSNVSYIEVNNYPNPFNNTFKFDVNSSSNEIISIKIYDMLGKLIENNNASILDINNLEIGQNYSKGIYNIVVTQGENIKTMRVVKN